jgi:membrane-associated phospholipid phosphatase
MSRPLAIAIVALVVFFAIYGVAVRTEVGQHADEAALAGGRSAPQRAQSGASSLLRIVSVGSLVAAVIALGALSWSSRRPWLIALPAVVVGLSLVAAELFKLVILSRPDLWPSSLHGNSFPSGHTAIAAGLGLSAVLVAPERLRGVVAVAAALFAGGVGILVVTADWHRPSDPLGSFALTLAIVAAIVALLDRWGRGELTSIAAEGRAPPSATILARRLEAAAITAGVLLFAGAVLLAALRYGPEVAWNRPHAVFLGSIAVILVAAGLTVSALLRILPPDSPSPGSTG